jgi:cell division protein FtsB
MSAWLVALSLLISTAIIFGAILAYQRSLSSMKHQLPTHITHALNKELQTLHDRLHQLENNNHKLINTLQTLTAILEQSNNPLYIDRPGESQGDHKPKNGPNNKRIYRKIVLIPLLEDN